MDVFVVLGLTFGDESDVLGTFSNSTKAHDFINDYRINSEQFGECVVYDGFRVIVSRLNPDLTNRFILPPSLSYST